MSAYVVDKVHIDLLIRKGLSYHSNPLYWYVDGQHRELDYLNADEIGDVLWKANVESVRYRYADSDPNDLPGPIGIDFDAPYRYEDPDYDLSAVETLKALEGYDYQTCERPDWASSEAFAFCGALRRRAIDELPGYDAAPWAWSKQEIEA